ncbi:membrane protein [Arthrobacter phage Lymara]|uniref:Membrane protein n=1 Tax=Arthrobacter phage Lymara TaxID=2599828 RepID=A0A5J6U233_9CAUD|nr:membrane protein [Arthrobacter phage Lymara]QFG14832.1 membrane protein [Arthrobacter phage Lymara]
MKKEIGIGLGVMLLAATAFLWSEHSSFTVVLLVILVGSLAVLTIYYMRRSHWRRYPSGRVFMYLIWAFDALIVYWLFSRLIESRDLRIGIFNVLIAGLVAAIWLITGTFWKSQRRARAERLRNAAINKKEETQP